MMLMLCNAIGGLIENATDKLLRRIDIFLFQKK